MEVFEGVIDGSSDPGPTFTFGEGSKLSEAGAGYPQEAPFFRQLRLRTVRYEVQK